MRVQIPGNHRPARPEHEVFSRSSPEDRMEVTVKLRRYGVLDPDGGILSREAYEKQHGTPEDDAVKVVDALAEFGLNIVETVPAERKLVFSGSVLSMEAAFGVELHEYEHPEVGTYRGHSGPVSVPQEIAGVVECVLGLDERPQAKPHFRRYNPKPVYRGEQHPSGAITVGPATVTVPPDAFTPPQLAALYGFPEGYHGWGETIGIIELGGGYQVADLRTYFASLGIAMPTVISASVDGGRNAPTGDPDGADGEVMLDIEVIGAVAPKAKVVVYFAGNTDRGFIDAVSQAIHDRVNNPSVISISWGGPESSWTPASMQQFDSVLQEAAALGVTVTVAAGDGGSDDGVGDSQLHADFPASSPHVLACGGTRLVASGGAIESETVWNDGPGAGATGGGFSSVFPKPAWQSAISGPTTRGLPDVSANADPQTGYFVRVDGQDTVIGGTSAVAPLVAGLIAIANEVNKKPAGFVNPKFYANAEWAAFRDVTEGNNGAYTAREGWDAASGLGSPKGAAVIALLK